MSLSAGAKLGPFEIVAPLGAGGMGEVYRARDTRSAATSRSRFFPGVRRDPDRLRRFEQEARAVAALNHPHICQIYDVGPGYLCGVRRGSPIAARWPPTCGAVALQIANALEAAHRRGSCIAI